MRPVAAHTCRGAARVRPPTHRRYTGRGNAVLIYQLEAATGALRQMAVLMDETEARSLTCLTSAFGFEPAHPRMLIEYLTRAPTLAPW
jgi:hypothetical protein